MGLRILIVTDVYPPFIGGVELQMQILGQQLTCRGHKVCVVTPWQLGLSEEEVEDGVKVYRIKGLSTRLPWFAVNPLRRHHPPFPDPEYAWRIRKIINQFKPDVIHAYGWITYSCAAALSGKRIPMLLSVREYGYTCALRTMMRYGKEPCSGPELLKCIDCAMHFYGAPKGLSAALGVLLDRGLLRRKTTGIHSVSTYMQEETHRDLYAGQKEIIGPNGKTILDVVIPSFRDPKDDQEPGDPGGLQVYLDQLPAEPFVLFVGALRLVKGLIPLLDAYQKLASPPPLVLIGVNATDTPKEFPQNVKVLYNFPHSAVMAAWERSLFAVVPSIWPEPFGNVIHEAMSKGKAVIGTRAGGQTDIIVDGETGLLVPPDDTEALAIAMQMLIDNPELCQELGRAGLARSSLFTASSVVPRFEKVYQQMVEEQVE